MSKAFTFEDAPQGAVRCPTCGRPGVRVGPATVESLVPADARADLGSDAAFCPTAGCPVGYFDALGRSVPAGALPAVGYPKRTGPEALACYCFGLRVAQVTGEEIARIRARVTGGEVYCEQRNPAGRRCVPDLLRIARERAG